MDILSLPDVFLHDLMRKMTIKDRLRMRLACRGFEKLVAESNAGYFATGKIAHNYEIPMLKFTIGDHTSQFRGSYDEAMAMLTRLRHRLFNRISFGRFHFKVDSMSVNMFAKLTEKFTFDDIKFRVDSGIQLERALAILRNFPESKHSLEISWICNLDIDKLMGIPPMDKLAITYDGYSSSDTTMLFHFINTHKNVALHECDFFKLEAHVFEDMLKTISGQTDKRYAHFPIIRDSVLEYMEAWGIPEDSIEGDKFGKFEIVRKLVRDFQGNKFNEMKLRYENCWIVLAFWSDTLDGHLERYHKCIARLTNDEKLVNIGTYENY